MAISCQPWAARLPRSSQEETMSTDPAQTSNFVLQTLTIAHADRENKRWQERWAALTSVIEETQTMVESTLTQTRVEVERSAASIQRDLDELKIEPQKEDLERSSGSVLTWFADFLLAAAVAGRDFCRYLRLSGGRSLSWAFKSTWPTGIPLIMMTTTASTRSPSCARSSRARSCAASVTGRDGASMAPQPISWMNVGSAGSKNIGPIG